MAEPDVLIIGAGVVGLTLARELAQRGLAVLVLTRDAPGTGASAAAAGMLEVHYPLDMPPPLRAFCTFSRDRYPALARDLRQETGIDVALDMAGTLALASTTAECAELERAAGAIPGARLITREAEWRALEPLLGPGLAAVLDLPNDHHVDPRLLCAALERSLEQRGVRILRGVTVTGLLAGEGRVGGAATDAGPLRARWTVNAAGAWAGRLDRESRVPVPVHPVKGQLLVLAPERLPRKVLQTPSVYLVPRPHVGQILVGATVEEAGFDITPTAAATHALLAEGFRIAPSLRSARHVETRVGLRPGTADGLPLLGSAGPAGYLLATGLYRKGVLLAPGTARVVADLITGAPSALSLDPFRPERLSHANLHQR